MELEAELEDAIERDVNLLGAGLMLIGRQIGTPYGKRIDLLAIDGDGELVLVEIKRDRTPRDVVGQLLDYASWVPSLSYEDITDMHDDYRRQRGLAPRAFEQAFADVFGVAPPDTLNESHRMLVVASELEDATERIIEYLTDTYEVPINAVFFRHFEDVGSKYIARAYLIDPMRADEAKSNARVAKRARQPWNGRDFYVSFGDSETRCWDDVRRYGFISGGGGKWYSQTLYQLSPGHRVFVHIPGTGYVGVGEVVEEAKPITEFDVQLDGRRAPLLEAPIQAGNFNRHLGDPDRMEHLVRVDWIRDRDREDAIWEKGFFANQNTACKLRNRFTFETLIDRFDLDDPVS